MNPLIKNGKIQVLCDKHQCQSIIYALETDSETTKAKDSLTVLKGLEIWYEGRQPFGTDTSHEEADKTLRSEARIYDILGVHRRVITYYGLELLPDGHTAYAIRLERAAFGALRQKIMNEVPPPMAWRIRIAAQVAEGVAYLHNRGVIWDDASTRNVLLCRSGGGNSVAKLCDFASSAPESEFGNWYGCETRYCPPGPKPHRHLKGQTRSRELFALGSIVYEITHWTVPYGSYANYGDVESAVSNGSWPNLDPNNPAADIIRKCWTFNYASADEIASGLTRITDHLN